MKRFTIAKVRRCVREAMAEQGLRGEIVEARWLGRWSPPRSGEGPDFRCAWIVMRTEAGKTVQRAFTAERDGSWSIR